MKNRIFRLILAITSITLIIALGNIFLFASDVGAGDTWIIQEKDLDKGMSAMQLDMRLEDPNKIEHPLRNFSTQGITSNEAVILKGYKSYGRFGSFDTSQGTALGSYTYQFDRPDLARNAGELIKRDLMARGATELIMPKPILNDKISSSIGAFSVKGREGDTIYWYIGVRGNQLSLLMVNGLQNNVVIEQGDKWAKKLLSKQ